MKKLLSLLVLATPLAIPASTIVVDDFTGGPHLVGLTSVAPPEIATGSFAHPGAIGGFRDAAVWSATVGDFDAGVAFDSGGYASFAGTGEGGIAWDGVAGIADSNGDFQITPDELDYGLDLDMSDCATGEILISAFTDLPTAVLTIALATDSLNYSVYEIPLTGTPGQYNAYAVDVGSPTSVLGATDFGDIGAVVLFVDGTQFANLDVLVNRFVIACPDGGWTLGLLGLGLLGLPALRRYMR